MATEYYSTLGNFSYPHLRHISAIFRQYHSNLNVWDDIELLYAGSHVVVNFYAHGWCTLLDKNNFYFLFETIRIIMWLLRLIRYSIHTIRHVRKKNIFLWPRENITRDKWISKCIYLSRIINQLICNLRKVLWFWLLLIIVNYVRQMVREKFTRWILF